MINLMPYEIKKQTRASRYNVFLLGYTFVSLLAAVLLFGACAASYYFISTSKVNSAEALPADTLQSITQQSSDYSATLAADQRILSGPGYYNVLAEIARILPVGSKLNNLVMSSSEFGSPTEIDIDVKAETLNQQIIAAMQTSKYLRAPRLVSINDNKNNTAYPKQIDISVTIYGVQQP